MRGALASYALSTKYYALGYSLPIITIVPISTWAGERLFRLTLTIGTARPTVKSGLSVFYLGLIIKVQFLFR